MSIKSARPYYSSSVLGMRHVWIDSYYRLLVPGSRPVSVGVNGVKLLRLLASVCAQQSTKNKFWAIRSRPTIRRIRTKDLNCQKGVRRALKVVIEQTHSDEVRRIAIWLRGRGGGSVGTEAIGQFRRHPDVRMRKVVTKALQRMHAWHLLREIAETDPDLQIRKLAVQKPTEEYSTRLNQFLKNVEHTSYGERSTTTTTPLNIAKSVKLKVTNLPKSVELIRYYLKRIRHTLAKNF